MRFPGLVLMGGLLMTLGCEQHKRNPEPIASPPAPSPSPSKQPPAPEPLQVSAVVASVSLADDCAEHTMAPAPQPALKFASTTAGSSSSARLPGAPTSVTRLKPPARSQTKRSCQQTAMQLTLTAAAIGNAGNVEIARVELLDSDGQAPLGDLTPRNPRHWTGSQYDAWDGAIAPGAIVKTSWDLSAPDWSRLGGSRDGAAGRTFVVRVTLKVGDAESVASGKVTMPKKVKIKSPPIMIEPPVMT